MGENRIIRDIPVHFPFPPYSVQVVLMEQMITALQEKRNALLESPTGTGKTLSLLCASRAWQEHQQKIDETSNPPLIIYASRTHAQLEQVSRELSRTAYKGKSLCLGSREMSCTHPEISTLTGRDQVSGCKDLITNNACTYREKSTFITSNPSAPIPDIEDMLKEGEKREFCPYYYARDILGNGAAGLSVKLVLMPYNYLFDVSSRKGLNIPWEGAVVIIDEAHNIEDVCEEACSFTLTKTQLSMAIAEIETLIRKCITLGDKLVEFDLSSKDLAKIRAILSCLNESFHKEYVKSLSTSSSSSSSSSSGRKGSELFDLVANAGLNFENYRLLIGKLESCSDALGSSYRNVDWMVKCLTRAFELGGRELDFAEAKNVADGSYRLFFDQQDGAWRLNFCCFSAGVAMNELLRIGVRSIVVASGTLSPLDGFASSLKIPFDVKYQSNHIVSLERIWLGVIPKGVTGKSLNSSYTNRENSEYQLELGRTIISLAKLIPDGVLVFFSGYSAMDACITAWKRTDIWDRLQTTKEALLVEARGVQIEEKYDNALASGGGAMMFAVCRGKASEGMDFRDKRARGVIIVGLPFPSKNDAKVVHKRTFLDETCSKGQVWYCQQAYRAINQAAGRVIRHQYDFGAIILLDERFSNFKGNLTHWLQPTFRNYSKGLTEAIPNLVSFFKKLKSSAEPLTVRSESKTTEEEKNFKKPLTLKMEGHSNNAKGVIPPPYKNMNNLEAKIVQRSSEQSSKPNYITNHVQKVEKPASSLGKTSMQPPPFPKPQTSSTTTNYSSETTTNSSAILKRPRLLKGDFASATEFMTYCKVLLSNEEYADLKLLLKNYQKHDSTKSSASLNHMAKKIFSATKERQKLLKALASYLPAKLGRALAVDAKLL